MLVSPAGIPGRSLGPQSGAVCSEVHGMQTRIPVLSTVESIAGRVSLASGCFLATDGGASEPLRGRSVHRRNGTSPHWISVDGS